MILRVACLSIEQLFIIQSLTKLSTGKGPYEWNWKMYFKIRKESDSPKEDDSSLMGWNHSKEP